MTETRAGRASPLRLLAGSSVSRSDVAACLSVAFALNLPISLVSSSKDSQDPARSAPAPGAAASGGLSDEEKKDVCVLLTPEGPIVSAYAICLYFLSLVKRGCEDEAGKRKAAAEEKREAAVSETPKNEGSYWKAEDALAWAAFRLRGALRGVRKDILLQELDFLDERLGSACFAASTVWRVAFAALCLVCVSALDSEASSSRGSLSAVPEMCIFSLLRYSHPTSAFGDWPALSKFLAAAGSSAAAAATLSQLPLPARAGAELTRQALLQTASPATGKPQAAEKFYVTTAINYTNGPPHMGHVYEAVTADVIARFHRIFGRDVYFLTGTDEHGQKIANTAERLGKTPQEICDFYAQGFQDLNKQLHISNDFFIRTTQAQHKTTCQWLWRRVQERGDIYLDTYVGWYNEREETFVSESEARLADYKDVASGKPLQKMEEPSYFFRMSKYRNRLLKHIEEHPDFIRPEERRKNILKRLEEPLLDLSCSRTTFSWGVPVPGDEKHVMYVWFDALTNYYSACKMNEGTRLDFWPANVHIIGKDILWFHTVIWPCMLMAAELPLPKCVFGHGFVTAADGEKMSKSLGNVVDPLDILKEHDADSFRFYLVREARYGSDLRFDPDALTATTNAELADTLGNLVHRATSLCGKFCGGRVPAEALPGEGHPPFQVAETVAEMERLMSQFWLREALEVAMNACRDANKFLTDWAPWSLSDPVEKQRVVRGALEAVYVLAHLLEPFIPVAAAQIFKKLNTERRTLASLSPWYDNLQPGTPVDVGAILFVKKKVEKTAEIFLQKCELRVGQIVKAEPHPHCVKDPKMPPFLVLSIAFDASGAVTRTGVVLLSEKEKDAPAGLVGRLVVSLVNVKPFTVKGVLSQVLVLAAKLDGTNAASLLTLAGEQRGPELVGSLVQAPGFPPVLRGRENLKHTEMKAAALTIDAGKAGLVALEGVGALQIVSGAAPSAPKPGLSVVVHRPFSPGAKLALAL
ncbi:methionyl-tRNA synthetase [Besnoitia besnoiti]|uniref:methionine--tRNA ligase n=1 Tax=Besnoitia besnoiti TaxID=94643 RepID=A0A2A9M9R8_BESBE|nr:methionyl-tRNA synthetase [Besnoitia besnoiti]PFH32122.1 methionyl-tRNA synthetase [Besnoitia besnoiti]